MPEPTRILAIDPGSERSAWVMLHESGRVMDFGLVPNPELLYELRMGGPEGRTDHLTRFDVAVIEWTAPRGMPASAQLFETLWWAGRFAEALHPKGVERMPRATVKLHLCGTTAAKDSNVHAALIDRFGGTGGKAAAVGLKASPGPLYGVVRDVWQALAVAVTYADKGGVA